MQAHTHPLAGTHAQPCTYTRTPLCTAHAGTHTQPCTMHIHTHTPLHNTYSYTITNINNTILSLSLFQFHFAVSPFSKLPNNFFYLISQSFPSLFYLILQSLPLRVIPYLFLFDFPISPSSRYSIIFFYMIFFLSPFSKATCFND